MVVVGAQIDCPRESCDGSFSLARLVKPLQMMRQELHRASCSYPRNDGTLRITTPEPNTSQGKSLNSELSPTTPAHSGSPVSQESQDSAANNGLNTSGGKSSHTSSRKWFTPSRSSGSASSQVHISYEVASDAKFVLAYSSHHIYCYDCELKSWSKWPSSGQIVMAAGSSAGYAVISKERNVSHMPLFVQVHVKKSLLLAQKYRLSAIRRESRVDQETWSTNLENKPYSLAYSHSGLNIAVGFALGTLLFDTAKKTYQNLPTPVPEKHWLSLQVDSQCLSFCISDSRLVVATREAKNGYVFTAMHNLSPSNWESHSMKVFRIPVVS